MVISNSFHAEVFSLIFNIPCYPYLDRAEEVNERLPSLLKIVDHDHVVTYMGNGHIDPSIMDYDFHKINERLQSFRQETYNRFLSNI